MVLLRLNLLSPTKRRKLKQLAHFLFAKELLELTMLTAALLGVTYLIGWIVLTGFLNNLAQSTTAISSDFSRYNQEIVRINTAIHNIKSASADFVPLTPRLLELIEILPADVRLTTIRINRTQQTATVLGVAKTRDALLKYQQILSNISWLGTLEIPPSQLFQKENAGFEITTPLEITRPQSGVQPRRAAPRPAADE